MAATNQQVQTWANERTRVRAEQIRNLYIAIKNDTEQIDDVYANLTNSPTWTDARTDGPPHLLVPNDILACHTFNVGFVKFVEGTFASQGEANAMGHDQYSVVLDACARGVG